MLKKIKDKIESIKEDLELHEAKLKKEIMKRGIFQIDFFAREMGLLEPDLRKELNELMANKQIKGYFSFKNTEFVTFNYLKDQINERIEQTFKVDLKRLCSDFGVSLEVIYEVINELGKQNIQHGFFDIPENATFFHVSTQEQHKFISILRKGKVHLSELADFIDDLIESKEDLDISSLISEIKSEEDSEISEWEHLAKDAIDASLGKKRASTWIENLMSWNKIAGNFIEDQEFFVSQNIVPEELANFIKEKGRISLLILQDKTGITNKNSLKSQLKRLEESEIIKGYFTIDESEYVSENKVLNEIIAVINNQNQDIVTITEIKEKIGLDHIDTTNLLKKIKLGKKINKVASKDVSKFFSDKILNETIMGLIEKNERILLKTINKNLNLSHQDLVNNIKRLIESKNLRILFTWDKSEIIKEEKLVFILMDILKKSNQSNLSEVSKITKIPAKDVVRLIKYMLEFGLIKGKLSKKEFILG